MFMNTVYCIVQNNLCISCGLCKVVCPKQCIEYNKCGGLFVPSINEGDCINCGKCIQICPGKGFDYTKFLTKKKELNFWIGNYIDIYLAWTTNINRRKNSTSGGIATELVYQLLNNDEYAFAFLVGTHNYKEKVCTQKYAKGEILDNTSKSRYLPVSQEKAVAYILSHKTEKIILIGTGCFVHGILNIIEAYHLNRDNYFIIGLFCDKTMTYNIIKYYNRHLNLKDEKIKELFFRTKEVGGWPGGVRFVTDKNTIIDLPNTERIKIKDFFQPECCLYCLDKINIFADISLGDNYTKQHRDYMGSSSVIIRTKVAKKYWDKYSAFFECDECSEEIFVKSQHLNRRFINYLFGKLKEKQLDGHIINLVDKQLFSVNANITIITKIRYKIRLFKINLGMKYPDQSWLLKLCLFSRDIKIYLKTMVKRILK